MTKNIKAKKIVKVTEKTQPKGAAEAMLFPRPDSLREAENHYCAGCGHGIVHRLVCEVIDEFKIREKVIAVAGTGRGTDTALVMEAASSRNLRTLRVNEIICKPLNPLNIDELRERLAQKEPQT